MSHQGPALALDSAAYGEAQGLRRGENIIDSLAYIDTISDAEKLAAENLIKEEVKAMGKRPADYSKELPKIHQVKFEGHPVLQTEWDRVKSDQPMTELDKSRYKVLAPPENRRNDVSAWHTSIDNAHSQLEHQYNRMLNLELLLAYGPKSWQAHIRSLEVAAKRMEEDANEAMQQVGELNKKRKLKHEAAGRELEAIESEWRELITKNRNIEKACTTADQQIEPLQDQLKQRGVLEEAQEQ